MIRRNFIGSASVRIRPPWLPQNAENITHHVSAAYSTRQYTNSRPTSLRTWSTGIRYENGTAKNDPRRNL